MLLITGFPENLVKGSKVCARREKSTHSVAYVMTGFLICRAATRHVQGWHVGDAGPPYGCCVVLLPEVLLPVLLLDVPVVDIMLWAIEFSSCPKVCVCELPDPPP